jgi:hypothetical protein
MMSLHFLVTKEPLGIDVRKINQVQRTINFKYILKISKNCCDKEIWIYGFCVKMVFIVVI